MKVLLDENLNSPRLAERLRTSGHDVAMIGDFGLHAASDPRVMTCAVTQTRPMLTRNYKDFTELHDLIMAAGGHHSGILIVRFDDDPRHNLTDRGIATALAKLEAAGVPVADRMHVLNQWR